MSVLENQSNLVGFEIDDMGIKTKKLEAKLALSFPKILKHFESSMGIVNHMSRFH